LPTSDQDNQARNCQIASAPAVFRTFSARLGRLPTAFSARPNLAE